MVSVVLAAAAAGTGALVGFALGVAGLVARVPDPSPLVAGTVALAAVALDLLARRRPRCRPLAVHQQVPREWGRIFSPVVAAFLYGSRLGVGPLTILTTWLWWAAVVIGAAVGPGLSIAVGVAFGLGRVVVSQVAWGVSRSAGPPPARTLRIQGAEVVVTRIVILTVVALAVATVVLG